MMEFFSNTGIQFFGDSSVRVSLDDADVIEDTAVNGEASLRFARRLFLDEWLPLSLDGRRNLFRIFVGGTDTLHYVMALDTAIRKGVKHSLDKDDVGNEVRIDPNLESLANDDLFNYVTVLDETKKWISEIYSRKKTRILNVNPEFDNFDPYLAYQILVAEFIKAGQKGDENENRFLTKLSILTDHAFAQSAIETTLVLDLGNSRTIGLLVEKDLNSGKAKIRNAAPLKILDFDEFTRNGLDELQKFATGRGDEYEHLISSRLRFRKNVFQKYGTTKNFQLPSICAIGKEAVNLKETQATEGSTGISGPKRYLWDSSLRMDFWRFHDAEEGLLEGEILRYLSMEDSDKYLKEGKLPHGLASKPLAPQYPRRTMMIFAMVEIIYQAFCQVNSFHHRKRVGQPRIKRNLKKVVLSFPTAMPLWERERLLTQAKKAAKALLDLKAIPVNIEIELGCDEASCSQIAFLYGETRRFQTDLSKFFDLVSIRENSDCLRIASLDIGGGTTDLMIAEYKREDPGNPANRNIAQEIVYSDGVTIAGDEILRHLISHVLIPRLRESLKKYSYPDRFTKYFGLGAPEGEREIRVEAMNGLLIPIAEFYLHLMEKQSEIQVDQLTAIKTLSLLNDYLRTNGLREIKKLDHLSYIENHEILQPAFFTDLRIEGLVPHPRDLDKEVLAAYQEILARYAIVVKEYHPDFLILGGRTTALPVIAGRLREWLTIPSDRIISLKNHYIGDWYPFTKDGMISDPKTAVVIGNAIAHLSNNGALQDVMIKTKGPECDFTLNFVGAAPVENKLREETVCYRGHSTNPPAPISLIDRANILYRNIDDTNMPCNLMYVLSLNDSQENGRLTIVNGQPLTVFLDFSHPKERLKISKVQGQVQYAGNNASQRPATKDDVNLKEQTLFEQDYFLDDGRFSIAAFY